MKAVDLEKGTVYFMVLYENPSMEKPIVVSYRYFGATEDSKEPRYAFEPDIGFLDESPPAEREYHFFSESDLESMQDLNGLISELEAVRSRRRANSGGSAS